ncbi:hypothetical protein NRA64_10235, partial [Acinetobacter baumannii]|nr:hypothetical protein [Acinetobacter baumannii]
KLVSGILKIVLFNIIGVSETIFKKILKISVLRIFIYYKKSKIPILIQIGFFMSRFDSSRQSF